VIQIAAKSTMAKPQYAPNSAPVSGPWQGVGERSSLLSPQSLKASQTLSPRMTLPLLQLNVPTHANVVGLQTDPSSHVPELSAHVGDPVPDERATRGVDPVVYR
jgi:hypothetical protein